MTYDTSSEADVRSQQWERDVKGFAEQSYVMKELVMDVKTSAWTNSFYQQTGSALTGGTGSAVKGIPRGADFPHGEKSWQLQNSVIQKYGMETIIYWEDVLTSNIALISKSISELGKAVANSVDSTIYNALSENDTPVNINTLAIGAGYEWDSATINQRLPIQDILNAIAQISIDNYPILTSGNGFLVVNEQDYANLIGNAQVIQNPTFKSADVVTNGVVGRICGLKIKVTPAVTADKAMVVLAKTCGTWKQAVPLTVETIIDPMKKYTIRACEIGVCELTDPEAVCLITNTRK